MQLTPGQVQERLHTVHPRIGAKVAVVGECLEWTAFTHNGYGRVWFEGRPQPAHRVVYTLLVGPVPDDLELDHLCRNRACVLPSHLDPVTPQINTHRSDNPAGVNARRQVCTHGHPLTGANVYVRQGRRPGLVHRQCRTCANDSSCRLRARRKAVASR